MGCGTPSAEHSIEKESFSCSWTSFLFKWIIGISIGMNINQTLIFCQAHGIVEYKSQIQLLKDWSVDYSSTIKIYNHWYLEHLWADISENWKISMLITSKWWIMKLNLLIHVLGLITDNKIIIFLVILPGYSHRMRMVQLWFHSELLSI